MRSFIGSWMEAKDNIIFHLTKANTITNRDIRDWGERSQRSLGGEDPKEKGISLK